MDQSPGEVYNPTRITKPGMTRTGTASRELLNIPIQDLNAQQFGHEGDSEHYGTLSVDMIDDPLCKDIGPRSHEPTEPQEPALPNKVNRYQILKRPKTSKYLNIRNSD